MMMMICPKYDKVITQKCVLSALPKERNHLCKHLLYLNCIIVEYQYNVLFNESCAALN